ncbi:DUF1735 domain-containing protein [Parabacteroides pacaensis]|uniref:DUF1735 domain-containing protein n=1 Tax=Parabacteroides pacaensis TaxID=2086575 RepID=UPI000D1123F2|nr:DUF1735 domain-containing protein [Parabacteroides pacaensis]
MRNLLAFILSVLGICSCAEKMDVIPNKVYIVNPAFQAQTVYDMGEKYIYPMAVYKSGATDETGVVEISEDAAYLQEYNEMYQTEYKKLPGEYYSLQETELEIPAGQTRAISNISVDISKIASELGYGADYVIPLKIRSLNPAIRETEGMASVLLSLHVLRPTFKFVNEKVSDIWFSQYTDDTNFSYDVAIDCDFLPKEEVVFELAIDPEAINQYNEQENDRVEMMPQEAFSIENLNITLKAGEKESKTSIAVNGKLLKNWHSYAIPITVKSVSKYNFDEANKTIWVIYRPDNLQGWYTVEGLEKNSKDWSVGSYPIRRFIKKTGPYTYETGYGARTYCDGESAAGPVNNRQYIVRNPLTNQLVIREGVYVDMNASNYYDPEKEELYICYEFEGWPGTWTHEFMHSRSNSK